MTDTTTACTLRVKWTLETPSKGECATLGSRSLVEERTSDAGQFDAADSRVYYPQGKIEWDSIPLAHPRLMREYSSSGDTRSASGKCLGS